MSTFHGGFLVQRVEGALLEPVRQAVSGFFGQSFAEGHELAFAARRGAPILHVAVRGGDADGKGYCYFHADNAALGGAIARAARAPVFAYYYEDQVGTEGVTSFDASGARIADAHHTDDEDDDDATEAPLTQLARELGVERSLLDWILAYATPTLRVPLAGPVPPDALGDYLASAPRLAKPGPLGWSRGGRYFPATWVSEMEALADRLDVDVGVLLHAAWEAAAPDLYRLPSPAGEAPLAPPVPVPSPYLVVPPEAPALPDLAPAERREITVALPPEVFRQVNVLAAHLDTSCSVVLQRAYRSARARLHAARRLEGTGGASLPPAVAAPRYHRGPQHDERELREQLVFLTRRELLMANQDPARTDEIVNAILERRLPSVAGLSREELDELAGREPELKSAEGASSKVGVRLWIAAATLQCIKDEAARLDASMSFVVQKAFLLERLARD